MRSRHRHLRHRRPRRTAGFTLVELMVSLVIGALVVAAMFTLGGASAHHFQEQQRVGVTQRSVRMAMERVRRDLSRAGYLHVPDDRSPFVRTCPTPAIPRHLPAVAFTDDDTAGNSALASINRGANRTSADRLRLIGNYATGDSYLVDSVNNTGTQLFLQTDWLAFRRSFVRGVGGAAQVDTDRFEEVFRVGRMVHVETRSGFHFFLDITGSTINTSGFPAFISVAPGIGADNPCLEGLGRGAVITPLSEIEYFIDRPPAGSLLERSETEEVTGPNTVLYRHEVDMTSGMPIDGTRRPILEYAVDFNLDWLIDTNPNPAATPPTIVRQAGATAQGNIAARPWEVRGAIVSLAARTPEQDTRFPWPETWSGGRPAAAPLNRYQVFPSRDGAARVRQLTTEVQMPNMVPR